MILGAYIVDCQSAKALRNNKRLVSEVKSEKLSGF